MGGNDEGFTGTIIKDMWAITMGGWKWGREVGSVGVMGRVGGKGRKLHLNNNNFFFKFLSLFNWMVL